LSNIKQLFVVFKSTIFITPGEIDVDLFECVTG